MKSASSYLMKTFQLDPVDVACGSGGKGCGKFFRRGTGIAGVDRLLVHLPVDLPAKWMLAGNPAT